MTSTELYDMVTLELEKTDALASLLEERLTALNERPDAPNELHALSLIAGIVCDRLQEVREKASELHHYAKQLQKHHEVAGAVREESS